MCKHVHVLLSFMRDPCMCIMCIVFEIAACIMKVSSKEVDHCE